MLRHHRGLIAIAVACAVVAFVAFGSSVSNGLVWDDVWLTTRNPYLTSIKGLLFCASHDLWTASALGEHSEFYRPLPLMSFALDRALGNGARPFHVGNVIVHTLNAFALGAWITRVTKRARYGLVAAAVFASLPLASEPVLWISDRFDLLGLFFVLAALALNVERRWSTAIIVACLVAASACKEPFIIAPAFVAIDDFVIARRPLRSRAARYAALLVAEALWLFVRGRMGVAPVSTRVTAPSLVQSYAFLVVTYGRVLTNAHALNAFHAYMPPSVCASLVTVAALIVVSVGSLVYARGRSQLGARLVAAGVVWTVMALAPVSVAGPVLEIVGDRYAYVPAVGVVVVVVGITQLIARRGVWRRRAAIVFIVTFVALDVAWCRMRAEDWRSDRALVLASLRVDPENAYALAELGSQYALERDWSHAENLLVRATANPDQPHSRARTALCFVYLNMNRLDDAERQCREALASDARNPRTWLNLATVMTRRDRWDLAIAYVDEAIALRPRYAEAYFVRGLALANSGRRAEAADAVRAALEIDPSNQGAERLRTSLDKPR